MTATLPNFLYIGPDKAGSSWLHEALLRHPQIFLSEAKDLYFFDRYYDRGLNWYAAQFRNARPEHTVVGEVCPDYLASPVAPARIHDCLGDARLMVTLREPSSRAFSSYLYMRKHGLGPSTFRRALQTYPELLEHGRYATQLRRFRGYADQGRLHISLFDDLQLDPQGFLDGVSSFLELPRVHLEPQLLAARLPASRARLVPLAWIARQTAGWVRSRDGARLVGRVKRSPTVQRLLYQPLGDEVPRMTAEDDAYIRERLAAEVQGVESDFGIPLRARWGW
ncbi:MAG: sulfotransferase family protein [Nocardioidaceae bacterium]